MSKILDGAGIGTRKIAPPGAWLVWYTESQREILNSSQHRMDQEKKLHSSPPPSLLTQPGQRSIKGPFIKYVCTKIRASNPVLQIHTTFLLKLYYYVCLWPNPPLRMDVLNGWMPLRGHSMQHQLRCVLKTGMSFHASTFRAKNSDNRQSSHQTFMRKYRFPNHWPCHRLLTSDLHLCVRRGNF